MLVQELEVFVYEVLFARWDKSLIDELVCELNLVISEFVLVEVELVDWRHIWGFLALGENRLRVDSAYPRVEKDFFNSFHAADAHLLILFQQPVK